MNYTQRKSFGDKVEQSFDDLCKKYKYKIIVTAIEKKRPDAWNMNMNHKDALWFWDRVCCEKDSDVIKFRNWLDSDNGGITPSFERYGPDRIVLYEEEYQKQIKRCGFSIKSKTKDSHKFYTVEAMDVFAHAENTEHYNCEIYYTFPPDNYSCEWRFCSVDELLQVAEYFEPPLAWKGSRKPTYKVRCELIYKPLWILFETNFSRYAGSL
jgi:hypothetical protein